MESQVEAQLSLTGSSESQIICIGTQQEAGKWWQIITSLAWKHTCLGAGQPIFQAPLVLPPITKGAPEERGTFICNTFKDLSGRHDCVPLYSLNFCFGIKHTLLKFMLWSCCFVLNWDNYPYTFPSPIQMYFWLSFG